MRVYLPATLPILRAAVGGVVAPVSGIGFAVTAGLRDEYPDADTEELEYLAMHDAALAALRLIAAGGAAPVRVVLAADVPEDGVTERGDLDRAAVRLAGPVPWSSVAAAHLDGGDAAGVVRAAAAAVDAAELGDEDAAIAVGDAEDLELAWYAPGEIGHLLAEFAPR